MESTSLSEKISTYILENYEISTNKANNIKIGSFTLAGNGLPKRFFNAFFKERSTVAEIDKELLILSDKELQNEINLIFPEVKERLVDHVSSIELREAAEESGLLLSKEAYFDAVPVVDMEDPKGFCYMVEKSNGRISPLQEKSWEKVVGPKHVTKMRELAYCGRFEYNPRNTNAFHKITTNFGEEVLYNTFRPPKYRFERNRKAVLDPRFANFLEGLFLPSCRSYAYNWLYYSSFRRIPVYLVLVGAGGIGKNLLAEALKNIHGESNFIKAPASALETKFNGHLVNCTMLYYDECKFSAGKEGVTTRKNRLKEWANDYVPIEINGVDSVNKDIYCSAVIATNNDSDVHLEQLDRKFSVLELSEERLEKRLGLKDTQFLWEYIRDPDFADAFLNWLEERIDPEFNHHVEYKGPKFDELVLSSLYSWQQELLFNYIKGAQTPHLSIKKLREEISLFPKHTSKIDDFLKNFTLDNEKLGKVVTIDGKPMIKINDAHLAPKMEESSLDNLE